MRFWVAPVALLLLSGAGLCGCHSATPATTVPPDRALIEAASRGDDTHIPPLLEAGASVNALSPPRDDYRDTPLTIAILNDRASTVRLLIQRGADIKTTVYGGETPLFLAVRYDKTEIVDTLLKAGADPNARNPDDMTPLMLASLNNNTTILLALLAKGSDVNALSRYDETALRLAKARKNTEAFNALKIAGPRR